MIIYEIPYVVPVFGQWGSAAGPPYPVTAWVYYGTSGS